MAKTITIFWKSNSQYEALPLRVSIESWRVLQREGVPILNLRQEDGLRHEIPLENVLYWSVDTVVTNDSVGDPIFDRYCNSCKTYFAEDGSVGAYVHRDHDVRRTCCGTSPQHDHHPSCTKPDYKGYKRVGTITHIKDGPDGLEIAWKPFSPIRTLSDFLDRYDR